MKTNTLTPELRDAIDAYWRAANYLSVGQIILNSPKGWMGPKVVDGLPVEDEHALLGARGTRTRSSRCRLPRA